MFANFKIFVFIIGKQEKDHHYALQSNLVWFSTLRLTQGFHLKRKLIEFLSIIAKLIFLSDKQKLSFNQNDKIIVLIWFRICVIPFLVRPHCNRPILSVCIKTQIFIVTLLLRWFWSPGSHLLKDFECISPSFIKKH